MSTELAILVPVLNRPHRVRPLLESIDQTTPGATVVFISDEHDESEHKAIEKALIDRTSGWQHLYGTFGSLSVENHKTRRLNYASKIRYGVYITIKPLLFIGADDLEFLPGWFEAASAYIKDGIAVVGINDLIRRRHRPQHATHFLMTREYAERPCWDGSKGPLYEGYRHSAVDDELIATATQRGVYAYASDAHVRHDHPMVGAPDDDTYRKGRADFKRDVMLFRQRQVQYAR